VRDNIKEAILSGEFTSGQTLVEAELGVSKTPVREALRILAGSGLVMMSTYKGASVRVIDATIARSVYDLRALLEPVALRRAVERGTDFTEARKVLGEAAEHLAILTAAENGDAQGAESLLRKHITDFIGRVAPSLTTGNDKGAR
jgi:DNA-binding GntR family transcriptional regulator